MENSSKDKQTKVRKHVSSACLECRRRHFKCDGKQPICDKCLKSNKPCQYVASHRGGSRKKGVSTKKKPITVNDVNRGPVMPMFVADIEDFGKKNQQPATPPVQSTEIKTNEDMFQHVMDLPSAHDSDRCKGLNCPGKSAVEYMKQRPDKHARMSDTEAQMMQTLRKKIKLESTMGNINCLFSDNNPPIDIRSFKELEMTTNIHNVNNFVDLMALDKNEIIKNYYDIFHQLIRFYRQEKK